MKFYDMMGLTKKCGVSNKYDITIKIASRARWLSENSTCEDDDTLATNEHFLSMALEEVANGNLIAFEEQPEAVKS